MTHILRIVGLSLLLLVGCATSQPSELRVVLTVKNQSKQLCPNGTTGTGVSFAIQSMSPEEFTFRYQNDSKFKASIQSYQFIQ